MVNTALVRLFDILNAVEKKRIKKKLENKERSGVDMLLLFNYLNKNIKKPAKLDKERVYKAVFGKLKKFNDQKLTALRFKLYRFIEDQIVIEQIMDANKKHQIQKELILLDYFKDKVVPNSQRSVEGISKLVESKMTDVENLINSTKVKDNYYHLNLFRLSHFLYYNLTAELRGEGGTYMVQLMRNLDIFYCMSKLRYSFEMKQRQRINNENQIPIFLFDEVYQYSESLESEKFPLIFIYRLLADLSIELNEAKIIQLKNKLLENSNQLRKDEMANSLNLLLNFMIQIKREKNIDMALIQYEVYEFILEDKIYIFNGEISPQFLINCAANFVRAEEGEKIEKMLFDYSDNIPKSHREKTMKLCNAYKLFGESKFKQCMDLVYKRPFLPFNLQAKILLLQATYEIEFTLKKTIEISFFDVLDNYKRFVSRKTGKINKNLHLAAFNLAICIQKLVDNVDKKLLNEFINNLEFLVERKWLLKKNEEK